MLVLAWLACSSGPPPADRVVRGEWFDGERFHPGAVVIDGGRVLALPDDPSPWIGPDTDVIDVPRITAGFVDAHAHPIGLGRLLGELDLVGLPTLEATLTAVGAASGDGWLVGRGWDQNDWTDVPGIWPTATALDAVTGTRPAALRRVDGHAMWVNTEALRRAGIDASTADPPGGEIVRDARGVPSGVLIDEAMALVPLPTPSADQLVSEALAGMSAARGAGLTGVHVMGASDAELEAYRVASARADRRVRLWVYVDPDTAAARTLAETGPFAVGPVQVVGVKAYADGALGSRGAWLREDYADRPGHRGMSIHGPERLTTLATALLAQRAQLAVHAIGDAGVGATLDAFAAARAAHPDASDVPLRVEHAQVVAPADVGRFAELGAVASMQPTHATSDMPWAEQRLGPERVRWAYAWRTLEDAGARVTFGSDFPVESHEPALGLRAATTRADAKGQPEGGWFPDQRFTEAQAVRAFTERPAWAIGAHDTHGVLRVGSPADLSLWSEAWEPRGALVDGAP